VAAPAPAAEATPAPEAAPAPVAEAAPAQAPESTIVLIVEDPKPKKKRRGSRPFKNELTIVDIPANFEIQARKIMPVDTDWGNDNLDTWWGRANLMVLTESDNFIGKVHLRMYPGAFYGDPVITNTGKRDGKTGEDIHGRDSRDIFQLYEAWAWHRGDYVNLKIGRWDNTLRYGSKTFGGYLDAKKDMNGLLSGSSYERRAKGFMSTYDPENAIQFGFNNFSENVSLDVALISSDKNLNRGDLRVYFSFKELAGLENMEFGVGYRSNVFDEIYSKYGDVTHTVDVGVRAPLAKDIGLLKSMSLFLEAGFIGLDDQLGEANLDNRTDGGSTDEFSFPILCGLDIELYRGFDKIVLEAEYESGRKNSNGKWPKEHVKDVAGSIYLQKKLNDRFTINLGMQSENNTKDFSFAGRLQGRIN
jgi:hypothetical protein